MIRNFLFHRVNPDRDQLWDPMDVTLFNQCLKYITDKYQVVLIEELALSRALFSNTEYATILFDDGYKDNIDYAAEILANHKCKASFYVVTDCIEKNTPPWTQLLDHAFRFTTIKTIDLDFDFLPADLKVKNLITEKERINYVSRLKPFLKKIPHEKRNLILEKITATYTDVETPRIMMNWEDLQQLKNDGHQIGSHSVTHALLGTMTDEKEIKGELSDSANAIKNKLGHFPLAISYPVGSYNETIKRLSKEAGYKIGLAVNQELYDPSKDDLFEIPRIELYNESWLKTKLRITHTLENIKSLIKYK